MYGSQIWGTAFFHKGAEFKCPLQTLHLNFLKGTLGVKRTTTNWAVLRECGHEPLQIYWFRAAVKFFSLLATNSLTLRWAVEAEVCLHTRAKHCWTAEFMQAFQGLRRSDAFTQAVRSGQPICFQQFTANLRQRVRAVWQDTASVDPLTGNNKLATYRVWFANPFADDLRAGVHAYGGAPLVLPRHLFLDIPKQVMRNVNRCRLRAHTLKVESVA